MLPLFVILSLFVFVLLFGIFLIWFASLFGPKVKQSATKIAAYECGLPEQTTGHSKIPIKFYLTAILFILFDIEIIFMYPWAVTFTDFLDAGYGTYILLTMGFFISVFVFGLIWEIKSRALEWE
jgi:NADH-quinone oxidoreductase subunit A